MKDALCSSCGAFHWNPSRKSCEGTMVGRKRSLVDLDDTWACAEPLAPHLVPIRIDGGGHRRRRRQRHCRRPSESPDLEAAQTTGQRLAEGGKNDPRASRARPSHFGVAVPLEDPAGRVASLAQCLARQAHVPPRRTALHLHRRRWSSQVSHPSHDLSARKLPPALLPRAQGPASACTSPHALSKAAGRRCGRRGCLVIPQLGAEPRRPPWPRNLPQTAVVPAQRSGM